MSVNDESELANGLEAQEILETQLEEFFLYVSANGRLTKTQTVDKWIEEFATFCHETGTEESEDEP